MAWGLLSDVPASKSAVSFLFSEACPESKDLEDSNRFSDRNVQACCCRQSGQESLSFYRVGEEDKKIAECLGRQSHPPIRKKKQTNKTHRDEDVAKEWKKKSNQTAREQKKTV